MIAKKFFCFSSSGFSTGIVFTSSPGGPSGREQLCNVSPVSAKVAFLVDISGIRGSIFGSIFCIIPLMIYKLNRRFNNDISNKIDSKWKRK